MVNWRQAHNYQEPPEDCLSALRYHLLLHDEKMIQTLIPERGSTGDDQISRPGTPAQIWLTSNIRHLKEFWPRSQDFKEARCYAFQCADILEIRCDTIASARKMQTVFAAILDRESKPLILLALSIEH